MGKLRARIDNLDWDNAEDKKLMMCCLVKCADISNEIRPTKIGQNWAHRVMTEFFLQVGVGVGALFVFCISLLCGFRFFVRFVSSPFSFSFRSFLGHVTLWVPT